MYDFKVGEIVVSTGLRETDSDFGVAPRMQEAHEKQFPLEVVEVGLDRVKVVHPSFPRPYSYKPSDLAMWNPIWCKAG